MSMMVLVAISAPAFAQSVGKTEALNREATVNLISKALAQVQSNFPSPAQALTLEPAVVEKILKAATAQIMDLRDALSDNHYIQVRWFSVDIPSGVTVQFSFPSKDRGE